MSLRESGKTPGLVEQDARRIISLAEREKQQISSVFDLKDDPLGLGEYGNSMLDFFLLGNIAHKLIHQMQLNPHVTELPTELSKTLEMSLNEKMPTLPEKRNGLGFVLEPVHEIAVILADTYPLSLPKTNEERKEALANLAYLVDEYEELVKEYGLEAVVLSRVKERINKAYYIGNGKALAWVLLMIALLGQETTTTETKNKGEGSQKPAMVFPATLPLPHRDVSPQPLGVPSSHTNGHSIESEEIPISQPTKPEQPDYVTYAESRLDSPIPGATELNPPSHRESLDKIMGLKIGKPEKINEAGWIAKAGKNGVRVVNLPAPLPSPERIEADQEVRGLAEIQTEGLDGTLYVYWLLFGKINSQPRYALIATVNPDGSTTLHAKLPKDYPFDK